MPSASVLEQKKAIVADLVEKFNRAQAGVLVTYQGITVADDTALRASLRKAGVDYMVIKNTLIGKACDEVGYGAVKDKLNGMTAIAVSYDDPISPAKILKEYADKIESFEIKAGFLDKAVVDAATVNELAAIPPKEQLIGKLLGSLQSSLYGLAYALQAIIDKQGGAPAEAAAETVA